MKKNSMQTIHLSDIIQLQNQPTKQALFVIVHNKSTFIQIDENTDLFSSKDFFWASPTLLCGDSAQQYNPCFVMAILSVTPLPDPISMETFRQIELPKVLFTTHPNIRRSMTLNAMRMSTELFAFGSERVFQLAKQRLEANQPDVVHDLLVYLMHAILDVRREYQEETTLRAESIAAYLGISPVKVLSLLRDYGADDIALTDSLEQGNAGKIQRKLNTKVLVRNQIELLTPYQQSAISKENQLRAMISDVLQIWENY